MVSGFGNGGKAGLGTTGGDGQTLAVLTRLDDDGFGVGETRVFGTVDVLRADFVSINRHKVIEKV